MQCKLHDYVFWVVKFTSYWAFYSEPTECLPRYQGSLLDDLIMLTYNFNRGGLCRWSTRTY
jgi:hypothetical protein